MRKTIMDLSRSIKKKKVQCVFEWYPLGSAENYQITLDKWLQFSRGPHSSHLISLLYPEALKLNASHLFSVLPSPCCYKSLRGKCGIGALLGALLLYKVYSLQQVWHGRGHYCSTRLLLANGITSC